MSKEKCPLCGGRVVKICKSCTSKMKEKQKPTVLLKWQHLHKMECPACKKTLTEGQLKDEKIIRYCPDEECDFRIKEETIKEILKNPTHPANLYKGK